MDEVKALTSKVHEMVSQLEKITKERNKYEKQCFHLVDEVNKKDLMLNEIKKIVLK